MPLALFSSDTSLPKRFFRLILLVVGLILVLALLVPSSGLRERLSLSGVSFTRPKTDSNANVQTPSHPPAVKRPHPIDDLLRNATIEYDELLAKETHTLHDAAQAYRDRRGRQPPPRFDEWYAFAQNRSALMIEDVFDQIYDDLNPFWGVAAKDIREPAVSFKSRIAVRNGSLICYTPEEEVTKWMEQWKSMTAAFAHSLPDLDIPINEMDESRMVVPWEEINEAMERGKASRKIVPLEELKDTFQFYSDADRQRDSLWRPNFEHQGLYWRKAVVGCPPDAPARTYTVETDFSQQPPLFGTFPKGSYEGYVQNWTFAKSPCDHPHLQGLHGTFIEPLSMSHTRGLWPLFGGSKLPMNNEILLPAAMYWTDDPFYSGGKDHGEAWMQKEDKLIWRGAASGGRNKKSNWTRFQRHRFLSMVNATSVLEAETHPDQTPPNFVLPEQSAYHLASMSQPGNLSSWVAGWTDAAFITLLCFPRQPRPNQRLCEYTNPYFSITDLKPMSEQYDYKYLPDIDGNSFSGRYRGFLASTSMPIKATIYNEWHDSRLVPWKHFVPMDNTFIDIYGIMEYFLGNAALGVAGHDDEARAIALAGKTWAEKVLRHEDMEVYVFRLLLEYARLCDDSREVMGWKEMPSATQEVGEAGEGLY